MKPVHSEPVKKRNVTPDHSNDPAFVAYYSQDAIAQRRRAHFTRTYEALCAFRSDPPGYRLSIVDIGGGAGDCAMVWAQKGHRPVCVDISRDLIAVGKKRAQEQNLAIDFRVGTATDLPLDDASCDIALLPELLEHVADWEGCLDEVARVLKPGGLTLLSTTNRLCPRQQEFSLPLYSWYPSALKRYCVRRSLTDKPQWVNYATYPALNWFTVKDLRKALEKRGFDHYWGRADMVLARGVKGWKATLARYIAASPMLDSAMQPLIGSSLIVARKGGASLP